MADRSGSAVTPDGGTLAWISTGSGEPVLLIAGQAVTMRSWDPIVPALAARFEVIVFDQRGIGESADGAVAPRTTRAIARDVAVVRDAVGIGRAHTIGHSVGGRVAQWVAIDQPDAVGTLVLISTTGGDAAGHLRSAEATADLASGDADRLAARFFNEAYLAAHPSAADVFVRK
ncbi:alpha/beta fold hydrolase [Microbacterium sp. 179-B 1A2 NHS]|uniref:alpha/beta fold hydrolase n=1 Tax=Microbacterium sp. 179-B 1A2 NHS TaxID=3142383 RepID=UPI0039A029FB